MGHPREITKTPIHDRVLGRSHGVHPLHPPLPTHSRAAEYPPRALTRLALAHAEVADLATAGIPTVCDRYATTHAFVEFAAQLLSAAHEVLARAVVHAREIGGTWTEIADALSLTKDQAQERYAAVIDHWQDTLAQPWQPNGSALVSRLPADAREPDHTAHHLDQWCHQHLPPNSAARQAAHREGAIDRMVSAHLPTQSAGLSPAATQQGTAGSTTIAEGGHR